MTKLLEILSFGAGVQSSTVALMSAVGELPPLDAAIFADTMGEPDEVYEWLDWIETVLPYPVYRVSYGDLEDDDGERRTSKKSGRRYIKAAVPMWVEKKSGKVGGGLIRKCTRDYKINPVRRKVKELAKPRRSETDILVRQWMGISTDEAHRMKSSRIAYIKHWYPLIQQLNVSREAFLEWMKKKGYPEPPRSACVFCPYHSAAEWRRLQQNDPIGYQRAADFEIKLRAAYNEHDEQLNGVDVWLTKVGRPLGEIDWSEDDQVDDVQGENWGNECEGMCGV